jgi:hypothetical protein
VFPLFATSCNFAAGINNTSGIGGKFAAGVITTSVVDTSGAP